MNKNRILFFSDLHYAPEKPVNNYIRTEAGGIFRTQFISKEDLNKNNLLTIICTHFGIAEDNMKGNWWFESCPEDVLLANRKELKEIIKNDKNNLSVFSGHQHWTKHIK